MRSWRAVDGLEQYQLHGKVHGSLHAFMSLPSLSLSKKSKDHGVFKGLNHCEMGVSVSWFMRLVWVAWMIFCDYRAVSGSLEVFKLMGVPRRCPNSWEMHGT